MGHDLTIEEAHKQAWRFVKALERNAREGTQASPPMVGANQTLVLADLLPRYWQEFDLANRVDHVRPRQIFENHFVRIFGKRKLTDFTYADGLDYQTLRTREGATAGTLQREWGLLMRLLNLAEKMDWIEKNRLKACPKPQGVRRQRVATTEELLLLQAHAGEQLWNLILFALNTGLRLRNVFTLEREWVDSSGTWIGIPTPRSSLKNHPPRLPLNALAVDAISGDTIKAPSGRVWSWASIHSIEKLWRGVCQKAGIVDLNIHDLRHTFATRLQNLGVGYEVRQFLLGHRMPGMTQNYSHGGQAWDEQLQKAVHLLDVEYRSNALVSGACQLADKTRRVVGLDAYKQLKKLVSRPRLERGTHALKGRSVSHENNGLGNSTTHPDPPESTT